MRITAFDPAGIDAAVRAKREQKKPNRTTPIPKRWMSPGGPIRVMCEPIEGYVMARRPQAIPFVLSVSELQGSARHPHPHGPFKPAETGVKRRKR